MCWIALQLLYPVAVGLRITGSVRPPVLVAKTARDAVTMERIETRDRSSGSNLWQSGCCRHAPHLRSGTA